MSRHVRRLLAERSRRGRITSGVLAAVALVVGVIVLIVLFPHREDPRIDLSLPTADPSIAYPAPLRVWPTGRVVVRGRGLAHASIARVLLGGRGLGSFQTSGDGALNAIVTVPADLPPGSVRLVVQDAGSGRLLRAPLVVLDPRRPGATVQPATAGAGDAVTVSGGGLRRSVAAAVVLDPGRGQTVLRRGRTTRAGLLLLLVTLPADLAGGAHRIAIRGAGGAPLAPAVGFEASG